MQNALLTIVFALALNFNIFSQTDKSVADPVEDDDIVKISTNLIQLDVTVTDKKGKTIRGLSSDEFEIYENGEKQDITNFSFIDSVSSRANKRKPRTNRNIKIPVPQPKIVPGQARRTLALVVDDLTLSFASTFWVKKALKKFVDKQMREGDLVAIIRTAGGIGALQQFTTDKRQLYAAIKKLKFNMRGNGKVGVFNPISPSLNEEINGSKRADFEQETRNFRENIFASGTLGAINFIVRGMKDLPGRKSIMLLSDGLPIFNRTSRGNSRRSRVFDSLQNLVEFANRSSVVIYTIDARGLVAPGPTAADNFSGLLPRQIIDRLSERAGGLFDSQNGLRYLASETGGFSIINNNNINKGIARVLSDQSYYLIGYQPAGETFDPKTRRFNKIEIKVKRDNIRVRYRSGFFGIPDEEIKKPKVTTPIQKMVNALTSPFAINDISLKLTSIFLSNSDKKLFVRSFLHIDTNDLTFKKQLDGSYKTNFDLVTIFFGNNGVIADETNNTYNLTVKEDTYRKIKRKGFVYHFTVPFKKHGGYQMRVAIRDTVTNRVGSANQFVEIPNIKKKRLTLSGIVLENLTKKQWDALKDKNGADYKKIRKETDPLTDSSLRKFNRGSFLRAGIEIYNAKVKSGRKPELSGYLRLIRDGKVHYESEPSPIKTDAASSFGKIDYTVTIMLGTKMQQGDHILQIVVTDKLAKRKRQIATQFVQFEIVE